VEGTRRGDEALESNTVVKVKVGNPPNTLEEWRKLIGITGGSCGECVGFGMS